MKKFIIVLIVTIAASSLIATGWAMKEITGSEYTNTQYDPCNGKTVLGHRVDNSGQATIVCSK